MEQSGPRGESSADGEVNHDIENSPEEVAAEQNGVSEVKAENGTKVRTSSWQPPNWTVWFPKPNHSVLVAS
jgi:hypothetical protein